MSRGKKIVVYIDDAATGHGGTFPDSFLRTLHIPCVRVQIQGGCTGHIQAADRPQANKELKRLVRKLMRRYRVRAALEGECKLHKGLTKKAREDISKVLAAVRLEFNESPNRRKGVQNAFKETLTSPDKHSRLTSLLTKSTEPVYRMSRMNIGITVYILRELSLRHPAQSLRQ